MKNGHSAIVLQPRDRIILEKLTLLRLLDRQQIEQLAGFRSISRANVRLARLRQAGLIMRYFTGTNTGSRRAVYALTKNGAAEIQVSYTPPSWKPDTVLLGNSFAIHQLALGDIYVAARSWRETAWRTFTTPPVSTIQVIPDALIETSSQSLFVEMDMGTEPLTVWSRKSALYLKLALTGAFKDVVSRAQFAVLVVTTTDARREQLRRHIAKQTQKLFWFATLSNIKRQGFWSHVWLRPTGETYALPGA